MNLIEFSSKSPHISLAKKILHKAFDKLIPYIENPDYYAKRICPEVTVLHWLNRALFVLRVKNNLQHIV